jgi:hypothetical protein
LVPVPLEYYYNASINASVFWHFSAAFQEPLILQVLVPYKTHLLPSPERDHKSGTCTWYCTCACRSTITVASSPVPVQVPVPIVSAEIFSLKIESYLVSSEKIPNSRISLPRISAISCTSKVSLIPVESSRNTCTVRLHKTNLLNQVLILLRTFVLEVPVLTVLVAAGLRKISSYRVVSWDTLKGRTSNHVAIAYMLVAL